MMSRKKIKVKRLKLTKAELQRAREKALKEFEKLVVWVDERTEG